MTIECYYSWCPHHSCHIEEDGPFCYKEKCIASKQELENYRKWRAMFLTMLAPETGEEYCTYPDCNCPADAPADPNWCLRGLPRR